MRMFSLAIVAIALTAGCATQTTAAVPGDGTVPASAELIVMRTAKIGSTEFQTRVVNSGGRVDFVFGDDRPFQECHASTIVEAENGVLLCAWFAGTKEKSDDVGIWLSRFVEGAWSAPARVAKVNETAHWNPVLFRDPNRGTYLFFKVGREIPFWETAWMQTNDAGLTWSQPRELVPFDQGGRGPVKNKPIKLSDGVWLAGASTEYKGWKPFMDRSEDGGLTWTRSADIAIDKEKIPGEGAIQPTLWESAPGHVHALMRTAAGRVARTDSTDSGRTWSPAYLTDLPNNNSGVDLLALDEGRLALVYNPVGKNWGPRSPLSLALSSDNGTTWEDAAAFEDEPAGEFSYPAIVKTSAGVAVSYTWKRQRIRVWQIPDPAL